MIAMFSLVIAEASTIRCSISKSPEIETEIRRQVAALTKGYARQSQGLAIGYILLVRTR